MAGFLNDSKGNFSSYRLLAVLAFLVILGVWAFVVVRSGNYQPLGWEDALALVGIAGGKVAQKKLEGE